MVVSNRLVGAGVDCAEPHDKPRSGEAEAEEDATDGDQEGDPGAADGEVVEDMPQDKEDRDTEGEEGMNKSKRVSGQGMERQKENRTPSSKKKRFHNIRAVSTPQVS